MIIDQVNAALEVVGAVLVWFNVWQIRRDREVKGINWFVSGWFCLLGGWYVAFYLLLNQPYSALMQSVFVLGNITWFGHALFYRLKSGSRHIK